MSYKVFEIPKKLIPNLEEQECEGWDIYDEECERNDLVLDGNTINKILELSKPYYKINSEPDHLVQHIKYDVKNDEYEITEHDDNTEYTIIIYLDKSEEVTDKFWVEGNLVEENFWNPSKDNYKAIIFWKNASHNGYIYGNGKRELLCIFSQSLWGSQLSS